MPDAPAQAAVRRSSAAHQDHADACELSVVIPLHNEEENVEPLYQELHEVLGGMGITYEILFVDDGSRDATLEKLHAVCQEDPHVRIFEFRRNFGQTAAMAAGFDHARGRVIVPMDGDQQNDPRDIAKLLAKLDEPPGYDVVSGWRRDRQDTFLTRKVPSRLANRLIARTTGVHLHDYGCTLKAYRREVMADVHLYSELHRFLPALAAWEGGRITEVVVNHRARTRGQTKYGLGRTFRTLFDLITVKFIGGYMTKPLYLFGKVGMWILLGSLVILAVAIGQRFGYFWQPDGLHLNRNILVALASLLAMLSAQFFVVGILTEVLVRTYHESQGRPTYRIRRTYVCGDARNDSKEASVA